MAQCLGSGQDNSSYVTGIELLLDRGVAQI